MSHMHILAILRQVLHSFYTSHSPANNSTMLSAFSYQPSAISLQLTTDFVVRPFRVVHEAKASHYIMLNCDGLNKSQASSKIKDKKAIR